MRRFQIEQSSHETCTSYSGLALVGLAINRHTSLDKTLRGVPRRHGISQMDLIRTYIGQLSVGKSDFDAIENVRQDKTFRLSLGIESMPSAARLRQRFDPLCQDSCRVFYNVVQRCEGGIHEVFERAQASCVVEAVVCRPPWVTSRREMIRMN
jgi:hypothetical protein